jgi:COMPASS component SWD2
MYINLTQLLLLDAFNGQIKHKLVGHVNQMNIALEASFTPDAQFVMCGSQDGPVHVWDVATGKQMAALEFHTDCPKIVAFNPNYLMFASADMNLNFWTPILS